MDIYAKKKEIIINPTIKLLYFMSAHKSQVTSHMTFKNGKRQIDTCVMCFHLYSYFRIYKFSKSIEISFIYFTIYYIIQRLRLPDSCKSSLHLHVTSSPPPTIPHAVVYSSTHTACLPHHNLYFSILDEKNLSINDSKSNKIKNKMRQNITTQPIPCFF